eukprot:4583736-Alexandrium_andersonii.AAC.1
MCIRDSPKGERASARDHSCMPQAGTAAVLVPQEQRAPRVNGGGRRPSWTRGDRSATSACGGRPATR